MEIFNTLLTLILSVATVFLTYYTFKLVDEARQARKAQVQPYISIYLDQAETDPTLLFLIIKNIGAGSAYNLTFQIEKDLNDYQMGVMKIGIRGLFIEGMKFCPPSFEKKIFLMETKAEHEQKMKEELIIKVSYKNIYNEIIHDNFHLQVKEQRMSSKITPSDTYIGQISESLNAIKKAIEKQGN